MIVRKYKFQGVGHFPGKKKEIYRNMGKWKVEDEIRKNERERRKGGKKEGEE